MLVLASGEIEALSIEKCEVCSFRSLLIDTNTLIVNHHIYPRKYMIENEEIMKVCLLCHGIIHILFRRKILSVKNGLLSRQETIRAARSYLIFIKGRKEPERKEKKVKEQPKWKFKRG